jgi:putative transposase
MAILLPYNVLPAVEERPLQGRVVAFFITSVTHGRRPILQTEKMALLLLDVLMENRNKRRFLLHEFVIMRDHFHVILTPSEDVSLEKAVQFIKGGFSYRAKRELDFAFSVWQESFTNHRIRDAEDYVRHRDYVHQNPVKAGFVKVPSQYPYSSASSDLEHDPPPPWLKPVL